MHSTESKKSIGVILSFDVPNNKTGGSIALQSSLYLYQKHFDEIFYIAPPGEWFGSTLPIQMKTIDFSPKNKVKMFLKSLFFKHPAVCHRFYEKRKEIVKTVFNIKDINKKEVYFIFEDIPISILYNYLKPQFPKAFYYIRSHNCLSKSFDFKNKISNIIKKIAWEIELRKIVSFEKEIIHKVDKLFAISTEDSFVYEQLLGKIPEGIIDIYVEEADNATYGTKTNLIHLGTADERKSKGLRTFIDIAWPIVKSKFPNLKFYIGGKNTELLNDEKNGIIGMGKIENESLLYDKGLFFINSQEVGSGIKIKSINAIMHKKYLITTDTGVEGIPLSKQNITISTDFVQMAEEIIRLFSVDDKEIIKKIESSQTEIVAYYSKEKFMNRGKNLLN